MCSSDLVTMTVMGLGAFPASDPNCLDMLGMHGSVYANYAVEQADLLIALGVRFDDRVTGKVEEFCKHGKIIHVDIDPAEQGKVRRPDVPIVVWPWHDYGATEWLIDPPAGSKYTTEMFTNFIARAAASGSASRSLAARGFDRKVTDRAFCRLTSMPNSALAPSSGTSSAASSASVSLSATRRWRI